MLSEIIINDHNVTAAKLQSLIRIGSCSLMSAKEEQWSECLAAGVKQKILEVSRPNAVSP